MLKVEICLEKKTSPITKSPGLRRSAHDSTEKVERCPFLNFSVERCPILIFWVERCPFSTLFDLLEIFQLCSTLLDFVQLYRILFDFIRNCSTLAEIVRLCSTLSETFCFYRKLAEASWTATKLGHHLTIWASFCGNEFVFALKRLLAFYVGTMCRPSRCGPVFDQQICWSS